MTLNIKSIALTAAATMLATGAVAQTPVTGWGDFKLYIDPGHEGHSNVGLWGYSEAEKVLGVGLNIKDMLTNLTDMPAANLKMCREDDAKSISLQDRTDEANAWGADFYYSIHSDAGNQLNKIVLLFGGWKKDGQLIEKTPNGGKRYGEFLEPNMKGVMRVESRGNRYDRDFYMSNETTHANQWPYLHVNRETNMPSLLSEGAFHTLAEQQQRNMNAEYRRLEGFAAFQAILKYRGMQLPAQTFVHGCVTNSENGQPINGATVTIDGRTYTTDTYASLFNKYTKNPDLIHNGLFTFEGLTAGQTYEMTVSAPDFDTATAQVTVKAGGETSADFVTFADIALTNTAPAKITSMSLNDLSAVSPLDELVLTFSRNMDRASVEQAFAINNDGQVTLNWLNDYTLKIDISALEPLWTYTMTIDGAIARNSQTNQQFDGDADGQPGGVYTLKLSMAEPDTAAPAIVSTYPASEGAVVYAVRPPIRVEYDEIINWNDDTNADCMHLTDANNNAIAGTTQHSVIAGKSVLHFYPAADLPVDKTLLVTIDGGLADRSGNVTETKYFRFMTEYRPLTAQNVILPCNTTGSFWAPGGSGSTSGLIKDESTTTTMAVSPTGSGNSLCMNYVFDESAASPSWFIRFYTSNTASLKQSDFDGVITYWVYGDGSNNTANMLIRVPNASGGLKSKEESMPIDFRGWNLFTWDILHDRYSHFTGTQELVANGTWQFDSFTLKHEDIDPDDEETPYQQWTGTMAYNSLECNKWDNNAVRTAKLEDIEIPAGVSDITTDDNQSAPAEYYNLQGMRIAAPAAGTVVIERRGTRVAKHVVR